MLLKYLICILSSFSYFAFSFNISPQPNYSFRDPNLLKSDFSKIRSSYFGFSLCLRKNSVFIGAPRSQSVHESQRKVNETGAIYRCLFAENKCYPYILDREGNTDVPDSEFSYDSQRKDYQWLGVSMDGGPDDNEKMVFCANKRKTLIRNMRNETDYLLHGICFWVKDTQNEQPMNVNKISPLRLRKYQMLPISMDEAHLYYAYGEQGVSVHITENNEEIIIGAPGIYIWKGSIIRYRGKQEQDIGGRSRRDLNRNGGFMRSKRQIGEYVSEIPNPSKWNQPDDSYFGYSVSSGFFQYRNKSNLLYFATAPQARRQSGEAYIFDIKNSGTEEYLINKYVIFTGSQFGEYFGYCGLLEDLNGDNLVDVIISAPLYAVELNYEKGAVYVFMNKGGLQFENPIKIIGKSDQPARFGTTISKLGDINHDGFKDIAISAPFEGDGVVYIYLGSKKGLRSEPSQIIKSPSFPIGIGTSVSLTNKSAYFGHGLSKGVDIDGNEFNDLAIGAPQMESVFIYRTYPVIKIIARVDSPSRSLSMNQTKFQVRACYRLESTSSKVYSQEVSFRIVADRGLKRVELTPHSNEIQFTADISRHEICRLTDASIKYSLKDIFKPIELEIHFNLTKRIPDSKEFCERCVAIDPLDSLYRKSKIAFSTGCASEICVANLKLRSFDFKPSFIIGSSKTFSIKYEILNDGENAYLPQMNVTSSNGMHFAKIPPSCKVVNFVLSCELNDGQPIKTGDKIIFEVIFETVYIDGDKFYINAAVSSAGNELNGKDNFIENLIVLEEESEIESIGTTKTPDLNLEDKPKEANITNHFEITNRGPSRVKNMDIIISIPNSYFFSKSGNRIPLIDFNSIVINATYRGQNLHAELYQNDKLLNQNTERVLSKTETSKTKHRVTNKVEDTYDYTNLHTILEDSQGPYMQMNDHSSVHAVTKRERNGEEFSRIAKLKIETKDNFLEKFPINNTIFFDCTHPEETLCVKAVMRVDNFQVGLENGPIRITYSYKIDLEEVDKILVDTKEYFIVTTFLDISKVGDEKGETISLKKTDPHNVISKYQIHKTPIWVYIISVLGGIILLAGLTYILYRLGFFKRQKKQELQQLYRESRTQAAEDDDDD